MKKLFLTILAIIVLATSAYAVQKLTVTYVGNSAWGGSYIATQIQIDPMTREDVRAILGPPTREYGYSDVWLAHDQIYIGYYNLFGEPTSVVILPVTGW